MRLQLNRNILILSGVVLLITTLVAFYFVVNKFLFNRFSYKDVAKIKVSLDVNKIPDKTIQDYVKSVTGINISLMEYKQDPSKFAVLVDSKEGKYIYNVTFSNDKIDILLGVDQAIFSNIDLLKKIITRLSIAAAWQKSENKVLEGSLFDRQFSDDYLKYRDRVMNNKDLNKLSIVRFQL